MNKVYTKGEHTSVAYSQVNKVYTKGEQKVNIMNEEKDKPSKQERAIGKAMIAIFSRDPSRWYDEEPLEKGPDVPFELLGNESYDFSKLEQGAGDFEPLEYYGGLILEDEYQQAKTLIKRIIEDLCVNEEVETPDAIMVVLHRLQKELT